MRTQLLDALVREVHATPFQPYYHKVPFGPTVVGWPDRLRAYFWPRPDTTYEVTHRLLAPLFGASSDLSRRLLAGESWSDADRARAAELALAMLKWGGVPQRSFSEEKVEQVFRRALGVPRGRAPMNSGWSKVAAMATAFLEGDRERVPHVIWDSRVSTSLVSRLDRLMVRNGGGDPKRVFPRIGPVTGRGGTRPRPLQLTWATAYMSWSSQDAGSDVVREIRDILNGGAYPPMPSAEGGEEPWTIRGVESVLFMDGY